jgi:hypothetical protein
MKPLEDAVKTKCSMKGYAILNWDMRENGFYTFGITIPETVVDTILTWRDNTYKKGESKCS